MLWMVDGGGVDVGAGDDHPLTSDGDDDDHARASNGGGSLAADGAMAGGTVEDGMTK
jgi:hypothetical protein